MTKIIKYEDRCIWTWDKMFTFNNSHHEQICSQCAMSPTTEMLSWHPEAEELMFQQTRLIFYSEDYPYDTNELQLIMNFRVYCLMTNRKLPEQNEEILRSLLVNDLNNKQAYDAIIDKENFKKKMFPIEVNENMMRLLRCGGVYVHGRDKNLRPIVVLNVQNLLMQQKHFGEENDDLIHMFIFLIEYLETFIMIKGRVENIILIIDCQGVSLFNAPYQLFKQVIYTLQNYTQCKLRSIFCLNSTSSFLFFKKMEIDDITSSKMIITPQNTTPVLFEFAVLE